MIRLLIRCEDIRRIIDGLKGFGITYDSKSISKFYTDYKDKYTAKNIGSYVIPENIKEVVVDGKFVPRNSLKSEVTVNTVFNDGVVSIGKNEPKTTYNLVGSWLDAGDEPGRTGSAHIHPFYKTTQINVGVQEISGHWVATRQEYRVIEKMVTFRNIKKHIQIKKLLMVLGL